jgi:malonyl CoA-acyl carrier protein transacylase
MQETTKGKSQMMVALIPLKNISTALSLCKRAEEETNAIVDVANNNSPDQVVIQFSVVFISFLHHS